MAEKGLETLPASTSAAPPFAPFPDSNSIASSETAIDFQKHTLTKRPWRLRTTSFSQIAKEHYEGEGTAESPYMVEVRFDPKLMEARSTANGYVFLRILSVVG